MGSQRRTYVRTDQANTYNAGSKQTFKASATLAGLNVFGVTTDPTGPLAAGDAWYNTTANRLKFYNGTVTKNVAFTDDSITGNASTASAFDHTPTQCTTNNFATGIAATGNANCSQPSFTNLSGQATNAQLQNNSVTVTAGTGLSGGGSVSLGGSVTLNNTGVTSLTSTANQVSVSGSTGAVTLSLPATINVNTTGNANTATVASSLTATTQCTPATNGLAAGISVSGAAQCSTNGSALTSLNASNLSSGTVPSAQLPPATSGAFGAVRPTIVNAVTTGVNLKNVTANFAVSCAGGRFVLGGGVNTDVTTQVMVMASYPSAANTWTATLQGMNNNAANSVQVTVYAICSGN